MTDYRTRGNHAAYCVSMRRTMLVRSGNAAATPNAAYSNRAGLRPPFRILRDDITCDADVSFALSRSSGTRRQQLRAVWPASSSLLPSYEGVTDGSKHIHAHAFIPLRGITAAKSACQSLKISSPIISISVH